MRAISARALPISRVIGATSKAGVAPSARHSVPPITIHEQASMWHGLGRSDLMPVAAPRHRACKHSPERRRVFDAGAAWGHIERMHDRLTRCAHIDHSIQHQAARCMRGGDGKSGAEADASRAQHMQPCHRCGWTYGDA